ncbi:class I glutamine amidotransferase-like protein [Lentinula raphanica]|nr:class I glutamine amidotransferase-like protein [Lentinula raphanica]
MSATTPIKNPLAVSKVYRLALCLYPEVTALDYQGPIEFLGGFSTEYRSDLNSYLHVHHLEEYLPPFAIDIEYVSHSLDAIKPLAGPRMLPTRTYEGVMKSGEQFDILMIPGGATGNPHQVDPSLLQFLKQQAPGAKHILTICTGSWILAGTGLLDGKKATSNKMTYNVIKESTKDRPITWIPKARFVVNDDKKIWTSSGVTAGMDMAYAFMEYLAGPDIARKLSIMMEVSPKKEDEDEFAEVNGLV